MEKTAVWDWRAAAKFIGNLLTGLTEGASTVKNLAGQARKVVGEAKGALDEVMGRPGISASQAQREINNTLRNLNTAAKRQGLTSTGTAVQSRVNELSKLNGAEQAKAWDDFLNNYSTPDGNSFKQAWDSGTFLVPNISKDLSHQISALQSVSKLNSRGKNLLADLQRVNSMPVGEARHALYESIMGPIQGPRGFNRLMANDDFRKRKFWRYIIGGGLGIGGLGAAGLGGAIYATAKNRGNLADHEKDPSKAPNSAKALRDDAAELYTSHYLGY